MDKDLVYLKDEKDQKLAKDSELAEKLAFGFVCFDTDKIIWIK